MSITPPSSDVRGLGSTGLNKRCTIMRSNQNLQTVTFQTRIVINKKRKTYSYFWTEDFVSNQGNVTSRVCSFEKSYSGDLQELFYLLNIKQYPKSHTPNNHITSYSIVK